MMKRCPNCGACPECGATPNSPYYVPWRPYPWWGVYPPYQVGGIHVGPNTSSPQPSGGTTNITYTANTGAAIH